MFRWELWIGKATDHTHWDIKNLEEGDYKGRLVVCEEAKKAIDNIIEFYQHLLAENA